MDSYIDTDPAWDDNTTILEKLGHGTVGIQQTIN